MLDKTTRNKYRIQLSLVSTCPRVITMRTARLALPFLVIGVLVSTAACGQSRSPSPDSLSCALTGSDEECGSTPALAPPKLPRTTVQVITDYASTPGSDRSKVRVILVNGTICLIETYSATSPGTIYAYTLAPVTACAKS